MFNCFIDSEMIAAMSQAYLSVNSILSVPSLLPLQCLSLRAFPLSVDTRVQSAYNFASSGERGMTISELFCEL